MITITLYNADGTLEDSETFNNVPPRGTVELFYEEKRNAALSVHITTSGCSSSESTVLFLNKKGKVEAAMSNN